MVEVVSPPIATPEEPQPRRVDLKAAVADGLVRLAKASGGGLSRLDLTLASCAGDPLLVTIPAGIVFRPRKDRVQNMMVRTEQEVLLAAGAEAETSLCVACVNMSRATPGSEDRFELSSTRANGALARLLAHAPFRRAPFRVQQFAIWVMTDIPARDAFSAIAGTGSGKPSDEELRAVRKLLEGVGVDLLAYRTFQKTDRLSEFLRAAATPRPEPNRDAPLTKKQLQEIQNWAANLATDDPLERCRAIRRAREVESSRAEVAAKIPHLIKVLADDRRFRAYEISSLSGGQVVLSVGEEAVWALQGFGQEALEPLLANLATTSVPRRARIIQALGGLADFGTEESEWYDPRLIAAVLMYTQDPQARVRVAATRSMGYLRNHTPEGPRLLSAIIDRLSDPAHHVRIAAAEVLAQSCPPIPQTFDGLADVLRRDHCGYAATALGRLKDPRAIPLLRAASRAEDLSLSEGAYDGLAEIGGAAVLNDLATHVATAIPTDRSDATKRLIRSADASSIPGLLQLLRSKSRHVRLAAVEALGKIPAKDRESCLTKSDYVAALIPSLADPDPKVRQSVAWRLAKLQHLDSFDAFVRLLGSKDIDDIRVAVDALSYLKDKRALPPLCQALRHPNASIRLKAIRALYVLLKGQRDPASEAALRQTALQDSVKEVRQRAGSAYRHISGKELDS